MSKRNWIVIVGQPIDTVNGGGFEFFGPYSEEEAIAAREGYAMNSDFPPGTRLALAIQLLKPKAQQ